MRAVDVLIEVQEGEALELMRAADAATTPASFAKFHYRFTSPYMRSKARERFRSEGDDASGRWAPLRDATEDIRAEGGFGPEHPINARTHDLEAFVTGRPGEVTMTPVDAALFFPSRATTPKIKHKLRNAQMGTGGAPTTVFGNPVGAPTPPRPVAAMDATDLIHTMAALQIHIAAEINARTT